MRFIVLFGPKHSGKTTIGRELAGLLFCEFIDLDEFIAEQSGKSPRALYLEGPEVFQKAEAKALAALFERRTSVPAVIASGGGIIDNPDALALFNKNIAVVSVFLDVSAQTAWERISKKGELPPFLQTANPQETHRLLHERRCDAYRLFLQSRQTSLIIKADGTGPAETAQEILKQIQKIG